MNEKEYVLAFLHFMGAGDAHKLQLSPGRRVITVLWDDQQDCPVDHRSPEHTLLCLIEIDKEQPNEA